MGAVEEFLFWDGVVFLKTVNGEMSGAFSNKHGYVAKGYPNQKLALSRKDTELFRVK